MDNSRIPLDEYVNLLHQAGQTIGLFHQTNTVIDFIAPLYFLQKPLIYLIEGEHPNPENPIIWIAREINTQDIYELHKTDSMKKFGINLKTRSESYLGEEHLSYNQFLRILKEGKPSLLRTG